MKKLICLTMIFVFTLAGTGAALAGTEGYSGKSLEKNIAIIELIASGDGYLVDGGVPFEFETSPENDGSGEINPEWASGGANHTHQYLTATALQILRNDKGDKTADLLAKYATTILSNSDWPDTNENDFSLYLGHFYDPRTGKTILGFSSPTALSRFVTHAANAKKYYAKNKTAAMQELGRALHYLADINVPHHAALLTALNSNHTSYENFADTYRLDYKADSSTLYSVTTIDAKKNLAGYCKEIIDLSAYHALGYVGPATSGDYIVMGTAAKATMEYSQEIMAAFLYNFLRSVGAVR
jgi:hypothetical protein